MNIEKQGTISARSEPVSLYCKDAPIFEYLSVIYNSDNCATYVSLSEGVTF